MMQSLCQGKAKVEKMKWKKKRKDWNKEGKILKQNLQTQTKDVEGAKGFSI